MASTSKSHTTPPGLNLMVVLLILAVLAVAFGCWFDDQVHRRTEHSAAVHHGPGDAVPARASHDDAGTAARDVVATPTVHPVHSVVTFAKC